MEKSRKEKLQEELNKINQQEDRELIDKYYSEFKKYIGKCFKKENAYSCPQTEEDYFYLYSKIIDIQKDDLYAYNNVVYANAHLIRFETDKYGTIFIYPDIIENFNCLGEEISIEEFNGEYNKLLEKLNILK